MGRGRRVRRAGTFFFELLSFSVAFPDVVGSQIRILTRHGFVPVAELSIPQRLAEPVRVWKEPLGWVEKTRGKGIVSCAYFLLLSLGDVSHADVPLSFSRARLVSSLLAHSCRAKRGRSQPQDGILENLVVSLWRLARRAESYALPPLFSR